MHLLNILLTSGQNLCEIKLVENAARNSTFCYHHDSKEILGLVFFFTEGPRCIIIKINSCDSFNLMKSLAVALITH